MAMDAILRSDDSGFLAMRQRYRETRESGGPTEAIHSLTPEERGRCTSYLNVWRTYTDNTFYQYQLGLLDDEYAEWGLGRAGSLGTYAQEWMDWNVPLGRASFRNEVDRFLNETTPSG